MKSIALLDPQELYRSSLKIFIEATGKFMVTFEGGDGYSFLSIINTSTIIPDLLICDLHLGGLSSFDLIPRLKKDRPSMKILVLSGFKHPHVIGRIFQLGANGFITKGGKVANFISTVEMILEGKNIFCCDTSNELIKVDFYKFERVPGFSAKQQKFLSLCAIPDLSYKMIADKMSLSPKTIDRYREAMFKKLNISSRAGLVVYAIQVGITQIDEL